MAIPTLSAISPSTIYTGGQQVTLTGTNFRGPYAVVATGPVPTPPPTVEVFFDGVPATRAFWVSSTEVRCTAPNHNKGSVSVTLNNLDSTGNPIAGETVTVADFVVYARADLSIESDFTRVSRALLLLLKQQVIDNVVMSVETDFTDTPGATSFDLVASASTPCVVLFPPTTKLNLFYDMDLTPARSTGSNTFEERRFMRTVDISWRINLVDDHETRVENLTALLQQFFTINTWLYLDRDPSNLGLGKVRYEMQVGEFGSSGAPNNSNLRTVSSTVTVRGFTYEDVAGFVGSMVERTGGTATDVEFNLNGETRTV